MWLTQKITSRELNSRPSDDNRTSPNKAKNTSQFIRILTCLDAAFSGNSFKTQFQMPRIHFSLEFYKLSLDLKPAHRAVPGAVLVPADWLVSRQTTSLSSTRANTAAVRCERCKRGGIFSRLATRRHLPICELSTDHARGQSEESAAPDKLRAQS